MWFWNKKHTIATSGILSGATDHHSHILPGVDDGVETQEEALRILSEYERLGVKAIWLTPHIMEDIPNTPEKLSARFNELKAAYTGNITMHLAAEYMIDNNLHKLIQEINSPSLPRGTTRGSVVCDDGYFSTPKECPIGATQGEGVEKDCSCHSDHTLTNKSKEVFDKPLANNRKGEISTVNCPSSRGTSNARCIAEGVKDNSNSPSSKREYPQGEGVKENPLLPIGNKGNHLLVETSYFTPPMRMHETLRKIKSCGYHPLLAHPERYMYMNNDEYRQLREEGIKFQLNLVSLAGGYGRTVKKKAEWLLKEGFYNVCGSDLHCENAIEYIKECKLNNRQIELMKELLHSNI